MPGRDKGAHCPGLSIIRKKPSESEGFFVAHDKKNTDYQYFNHRGIHLANTRSKNCRKHMINERIALVMLEGEVPESCNDPHHTKQFYKAIQNFAIGTISLCEQKKFIKLERHLKVALKMFKDGNDNVRNGIVNVYLYTLSHMLDKDHNHTKWIDAYMPHELKHEIARQHNTSAL